MDVVIHLANRAHRAVNVSGNEAELTRCINVDATVRLAESAAQTGVEQIVYVSSIHVNGSATTNTPFTEHDSPAPVGLYAQSKWQAEQALRNIEATTRLAVTIVRPPLVYGPDVKGNMLTLLKLVKRAWPMPLGSVHNRRSLVAVTNLADLISRCIDHPAARGNLFLAADGQDVSTPDLVRMIAGAMGVRVRLPRIPLRALGLIARAAGRHATFESFAGNLQVSNASARTALGWEPRISLQQGIEVMTEWFVREHC
jgi:nucleoside-diphosphate-sugar epimerase